MQNNKAIIKDYNLRVVKHLITSALIAAAGTVVIQYNDLSFL